MKLMYVVRVPFACATCSKGTMEAAHGIDTFEILSYAVGRGLGFNAMQDLLARVGMPQETEEERRRALSILRMAASRDSNAVEAVLDALRTETIQPNDRKRTSALLSVLQSGSERAVMAVVDRMREEGMEHPGWLLTPFFEGSPQLLENDELANRVLGLMPAAAFETASPYGDCVYIALFSTVDNDWEHLVELCLMHGPPMEERLEGTQTAEDADLYCPRLRYVAYAAALGDANKVRKLHEMVPLLPDGSGRRADVADYAKALGCVDEESDVLESEEIAAIIDYLVEQAGGVEVLDLCDPALCLRANQTMERVAERAPHLVEMACKEPNAIWLLSRQDPEDLEFATAKILELVDPKVIVAMMRQEARDGRRTAGGWRWQMEKLHKAVPESMDGLEWSWLMDAIREKAYRDVEYMLEMCKREHLVMRNEDGDTPFDVAARDERFPRELLQQLKVAAKGAHA